MWGRGCPIGRDGREAPRSIEEKGKMMRLGIFALGGTIILCATLSGRPCAESTAADLIAPGKVIVPIDRPLVLLAPYVWIRQGEGLASRAEAVTPGAYIKASFRDSSTLGLVVDGTANRGCPVESLPVIEYSIDDGEFHIVRLRTTDAVYTLPLADGLDVGVSHPITIMFRAADLTRDRWRRSTARLRVAGFEIDQGGSVAPTPALAKRALAFGDSMTEGVGVDGLFTSWQSLDVNNARATWFPIVASALGCEYGQFGSGGLGMTRELEIPPLSRIWDRYDAKTSRLIEGKLTPEPDYIFCFLGTNDYEKDITNDYINWLIAMRAACPRALFFCIPPPLGVHRGEVDAAVADRRKAGDSNVHLIALDELKSAFRAGRGATRLAHDGVHPSAYGQAIVAASIAVKVQRILNR